MLDRSYFFQLDFKLSHYRLTRLQMFLTALVSCSEAVETAEGAFGRFFHRAKAAVLIKGPKKKKLNVCPDSCRRWFDRKAARTSTVIATKALACKLAKVAWHVMAKNTDYDRKRIFPNEFSRATVSQVKGLAKALGTARAAAVIDAPLKRLRG